MTEMTTDELVAVSQDRDSSDGMATKQFLITWTVFDSQINMVQWNVRTPASQNLVNLRMCINFFNMH